MRTLTRPMFNMGGPIKQGVMHGIREPYAGGSRAALVGNPVYPRTGGREHHWAPLAIGGINAARWLATQGIRKLAQKGAGQTFKNIGASYGLGGLRTGASGASGGFGTAVLPRNRALTIIPRAASKASKLKNWAKGWWSGDPSVKGVKWLGRTLTSPTASGLAQKTAKSIFSPTGIGISAATYAFWPDGTKKTAEEIAQTSGQHGPFDHTQKKKSEADRKIFAKAQQEDRVQKYLKMMGYDRAKKTAIADALIDASKIVGERGTLDPKNITQELINPIIQATSKRLDKPDQIREAVGLMATKAAIEKDLEDPSIKALRLKQLEAADREALKDTVGGDIRAYNTKHGKLPVGTNLAQIVRLRGGEVAGVPNTTEVKKWMKANETDEVGFLEELIKTTKVAPGTYVVNNQILIVDENSIVQPYTY